MVFFLLDYSDEMLSWTPSDDALEDLCHTIGSATFQLGIELGLDIVTLQSIEIKHRVNRSNKSSVAKMEIREMFTQTNKLSIKNISKITEASREIK